VTNLAARLGDHARSGQVLLSQETAQRVKARFSLKKVGRVSVKNVSEPVDVWELEGGDEVFDEEDFLTGSD
jgi:class 3 adenylate cyclase